MEGPLHIATPSEADASKPSQRPLPFEEHLTAAFARLRDAIRGVLVALDVDQATPPEVARRLKLSRNLTWKVSKVLATSDLHEALQHLPGDAGLDLFLNAAQGGGAPADTIRSVRDACRELDRVVEVHVGDRGTLDLYLDGMAGGDNARLEQSRKLAFRGNSGIWGLQAKSRVTAAFMAPSLNDPDALDLAMVGGICGLRRLRPDVRWPLFRVQTYDQTGEPQAFQPVGEAIDPAFSAPNMPQLIGDYCSTTDPPIRAVRDARGWVYELMEGRVGNTGAFTCFFGSIYRNSAPRYATPEDQTGEFASHITLPFEVLQFDAFVHRDLEFATNLEVATVGQFDGASPVEGAMQAPIADRIRELSGHPPLVSTPLVDGYDRLVERVVEGMGRNARDFRAFRLTVAYPPMHAMVKLRFPLPTKA
jgi:hypothetical protein